MRNIYPNLMIKMLSGDKKKSKYFFQILLAYCIGVCAYTHATFLVGEINRAGPSFIRGNILLLTKNRRSNFFVYF